MKYKKFRLFYIYHINNLFSIFWQYDSTYQLITYFFQIYLTTYKWHL